MRRKRRGASPAEARVTVGDTSVQVGDRIKYLGLYLDAAWSFGGHVERLAPRAESVVASLSCLNSCPILGPVWPSAQPLCEHRPSGDPLTGPSSVWADALMASRRSLTLLRRVFMRVAIRIVRGYRTVSHTAATLLAGTLPIELYANMYAWTYRRTRELGGLGVTVTPKVKAAVRLQTGRRALER
ncbi:hypothetical protein ACFW04_012272 [Cataglyphis niger]